MSFNNNYLPLKPSKEVLDIISYCFYLENKGDTTARRNAMKILKDHLILTKDGSYTLESAQIQGNCETMHTHHGAIEESLNKFVIPSKLENKDQVKILDICSGLGYNAAAAIDYLKKINPNVAIEIDMVEISKETLAASLLIPNPLPSYQIIKKNVEDSLYNEGFLKYKQVKNEKRNSFANVKINIFYDDARMVIKDLERFDYDAVFLDPFSPSKSPELYTVEFFKYLKDNVKKDGIISTYTSAAPIRSAFIEAGFHVGEGPSFGRIGGTLASLSLDNIKKPLSIADERMIALSDAGIPFSDYKLGSSSKEIIKLRDKKRRMVRGIEKLPSTVKTPVYLGEDIDNQRLKRRVLKNLNKMNISGLKSIKARYLVCPQFQECFCGCGIGRLGSSKDRIEEMKKRLEIIIN
ncbi:MAG: tRNA (5-methylaminomethyl-2-thiouridine)(34)-methyltransferase MnmD [Methanomicrobiales archaeon]